MKATKRSYLRKLNSLTQLSNAARHWVPDLDTFFVDPVDRLPFDPTVPHAVTLATNEHAADQPLGRATCICGADTGLAGARCGALGRAVVRLGAGGSAPAPAPA